MISNSNDKVDRKHDPATQIDKSKAKLEKDIHSSPLNFLEERKETSPVFYHDDDMKHYQQDSTHDGDHTKSGV